MAPHENKKRCASFVLIGIKIPTEIIRYIIRERKRLLEQNPLFSKFRFTATESLSVIMYYIRRRFHVFPHNNYLYIPNLYESSAPSETPGLRVNEITSNFVVIKYFIIIIYLINATE